MGDNTVSKVNSTVLVTGKISSTLLRKICLRGLTDRIISTSSHDTSKPWPLAQELSNGFGPFGVHEVNASWIAVRELQKLGLNSDFDLVTRELPVEYNTVKTLVPTLWSTINPKLVVHVGVSGIAKALTLEQLAHNHGYDKCDVQGVVPETLCCVDGARECITSNINMKQICEHVNKSSCGVEAVVSLDPGRYLCDFTYYTSLNINDTCTAFIHVPPLDKPYSAIELAHGIREAILAMLKQC